jgi:phosphoglycolate phosphatase-like HAD superfamily hydrolase
MKCLIFDFDQTLVDYQCIERLRRLRQWAIVYQKIPTIFAYEGIDKVLSIAKEKDIKISIVSSSPSSYVQRVVKNLGWSFDAMICYHDTILHKPQPEPFIEAAKECWTVGDHPNDIIAARRAGMFTIGAEWGSIDCDALRRENPDILCNTVSSFYEAIYEKLLNQL